MQNVLDLIMIIGPSALAAGAAFGGVRMSLNGTRQSVLRIEEKVDRIDEQTQDNRVEISRLDSRCHALHRLDER